MFNLCVVILECGPGAARRFAYRYEHTMCYVHLLSVARPAVLMYRAFPSGNPIDYGSCQMQTLDEYMFCSVGTKGDTLGDILRNLTLGVGSTTPELIACISSLFSSTQNHLAAAFEAWTLGKRIVPTFELLDVLTMCFARRF